MRTRRTSRPFGRRQLSDDLAHRVGQLADGLDRRRPSCRAGSRRAAAGRASRAPTSGLRGAPEVGRVRREDRPLARRSAFADRGERPVLLRGRRVGEQARGVRGAGRPASRASAAALHGSSPCRTSRRGGRPRRGTCSRAGPRSPTSGRRRASPAPRRRSRRGRARTALAARDRRSRPAAPRSKSPDDAPQARGEQAAAALDEGVAGAGVDDERPLRAQGVGDPALARAQRRAGRAEDACRRPRRAGRRSRVPRLSPGGDHGERAGLGGALGGAHLGGHAAGAEARAAHAAAAPRARASAAGPARCAWRRGRREDRPS